MCRRREGFKARGAFDSMDVLPSAHAPVGVETPEKVYWRRSRLSPYGPNRSRQRDLTQAWPLTNNGSQR